MELELHQLELRYARLRKRQPAQERQLVASLAELGQQLPIVPGMVCDVEIMTGRRTILSYLFKPVTKALGQALTER